MVDQTRRVSPLDKHLKIWRRIRRAVLRIPVVVREIRGFRQQFLPAVKVRIAVIDLQTMRIVNVAADFLAELILVANEDNALKRKKINAEESAAKGGDW